LYIFTDSPAFDIDSKHPKAKMFYYDTKFLIAIIILVTVLICSAALMIICFKCRKLKHFLFLLLKLKLSKLKYKKNTGQRKNQKKNVSLESIKNSDIKRDRFYATIHKPGMQMNDKIPGESKSF
jgi:hypothetical protein